MSVSRPTNNAGRECDLCDHPHEHGTAEAKELLRHWLEESGRWQARAVSAEQALRVISPDRLEALAWLLDEADNRAIWWFTAGGDGVQRDLREMARLSRLVAVGGDGQGQADTGGDDERRP